MLSYVVLSVFSLVLTPPFFFFFFFFFFKSDDPIETMTEVFAYAEEHMGVPPMLNPEDVVEFQEEKSIATYCAYLFDLYGQAPLVFFFFFFF